MNKGINLTESQIKAYENGATMFLFFANKYRIESEFDKCIFPIKKGDKDIFIKEDRYENIDGNFYFNTVKTDDFNWYPASLMTKNESRYSFSKCIDVVGPIRVHEISGSHLKKLLYEVPNTIMEQSLSFWKKSVENRYQEFIKYYNQQLREQNIERKYQDNDYIFLIEFER